MPRNSKRNRMHGPRRMRKDIGCSQFTGLTTIYPKGNRTLPGTTPSPRCRWPLGRSLYSRWLVHDHHERKLRQATFRGKNQRGYQITGTTETGLSRQRRETRKDHVRGSLLDSQHVGRNGIESRIRGSSLHRKRGHPFFERDAHLRDEGNGCLHGTRL